MISDQSDYREAKALPLAKMPAAKTQWLIANG
jgi:hypothetical protein